MVAPLDRFGGWGLRQLLGRPFVAGLSFLGLELALLLGRSLPSPILSVACRIAVVALLVGALVFLFSAWRLIRRQIIATRRGDAAEVRRVRGLLHGAGPASSAREAAIRTLGEGEVLLMEERWTEARTTLESIDVTALPRVSRPAVESEIGYAMAHEGDVVRGVEVAMRALRDAESLPRYSLERRTHVLRRTGVAHVLADLNDQGETLLLEALRSPYVTPHERAEILFFLARVRHARGDSETATRMLSLGAACAGPWAKRASLALAAAARSPHRDPGPLIVRVSEEDPAPLATETEDALEAKRRARY